MPSFGDDIKGSVDGRGVRGEKTVGLLLDAALRLWSARGFAGASVRDIAQEAGVNPGLVRYHFQSKEGLYERVLDVCMGGLRDALLGALSLDVGMEERLLGALRGYQEHLLKQPEVPRLIMRGLLDGDSRVVELVGGHLRPLWEALSLSFGGEETSLGGLKDVVMSMFGALVAPALYGPLFRSLWGEEVLSEEGMSRRMTHIESWVARILRDRDELLEER